jgi:hypothetical protein
MIGFQLAPDAGRKRDCVAISNFIEQGGWPGRDAIYISK